MWLVSFQAVSLIEIGGFRENYSWRDTGSSPHLYLPCWCRGRRVLAICRQFLVSRDGGHPEGQRGRAPGSRLNSDPVQLDEHEKRSRILICYVLFYVPWPIEILQACGILQIPNLCLSIPEASTLKDTAKSPIRRAAASPHLSPGIT